MEKVQKLGETPPVDERLKIVEQRANEIAQTIDTFVADQSIFVVYMMGSRSRKRPAWRSMTTTQFKQTAPEMLEVLVNGNHVIDHPYQVGTFLIWLWKIEGGTDRVFICPKHLLDVRSEYQGKDKQ